MESVTLYDLSPVQVLDIVRDLKHNGRILGIDFDFEYSPPTSSYVDDEYLTTRRFTTFSFYTQEEATWFALKWG